MQKQGNGKSVVHNKPEYANVQMLWWEFYWLTIYESLSYLQNSPDS